MTHEFESACTNWGANIWLKVGPRGDHQYLALDAFNMNHTHPDVWALIVSNSVKSSWHQLRQSDGNSSTLVWEPKTTPLEYLMSTPYHRLYIVPNQKLHLHVQHSSPTSNSPAYMEAFPSLKRCLNPFCSSYPLFSDQPCWWVKTCSVNNTISNFNW